MTKRQIKILMPWIKGVVVAALAVGAVYGCSQIDGRTSYERFEHWDEGWATVKRTDKRSECLINIEFRAAGQANTRRHEVKIGVYRARRLRA